MKKKLLLTELLITIIIATASHGFGYLRPQLASYEEIGFVECFKSIYAQFGNFRTSLFYNRGNWIVDQLFAVVDVKQKVNKLQRFIRYFDFGTASEFIYAVIANVAEMNDYLLYNNIFAFSNAHHLIMYIGDHKDIVSIIGILKKSRISTTKTTVLDGQGNIHRMQDYVDSCSGIINKRTIFANCSSNGIEDLRKFYVNPIEDFMGCKITCFELSHTYEFHHLNLIAKAHNVALAFYHRQNNEIIFANFLAGLSMRQDDYIYPYKLTLSQILVPLASKVPRWLNFKYAFEGNVWIAILAASLIACFVYLLAAKALNLSCNIVDVAMEIYSILLFQSARIPNSFSLKLLITCWLFFALITTSAFAGLFYSQLFKEFDGRQIKTLEDIENAGLRVHGRKENLRDKFGADSYIYKTNVDVRAVQQRNPYAVWFETINKYKNISIFIDTLTIEYMKIDKSIMKNLYPIRIEQNYLTAKLAKGHPLTRHLNSKFGRFFEMGMLVKWNRDHLEANRDFDDEDVPLKMGHLRFPFGCLILGLLISTAHFLFEQFRFKHNNY